MQSIKIAYKLSRKAVPFPDIFRKYGAHLFQDALANFITSINNPGLGTHALHVYAADTLLSFHTVCIYHNIKFTAANDAQELEIVDAVHIQPEQKDKYRWIIPECFDTVLVWTSHTLWISSFTILKLCDTFYIKPFADIQNYLEFAYLIIWYFTLHTALNNVGISGIDSL